ncbi:hypothetical protein F4859DRAFT_11180 [Xylaria cf. heliscus]|nr:hypothetical protein F4859DRAFT_11180 [Xylaria cf. heliscus]
MPSIKTLTATALAALLPLASASATIGSISTPATVAAGDNITVTLGTSIYIQNWEDFSIIWGLAPTRFGGQGSDGQVYVGTQIGYTPLFGTDTEKLNSFTVDVQIPEQQTPGDWLLVAAVPYLVGASGSTGVRAFNTTINVTA